MVLPKSALGFVSNEFDIVVYRNRSCISRQMLDLEMRLRDHKKTSAE